MNPALPVTIVFGNKETLLNQMYEAALRKAYAGINFQFLVATRVGGSTA